MAKQTWNPGTAPTGVGGDTPYSANTKHQYNANELYAHCGADADGNLPDAQPINKGGTGATTAEQARQNLGLGAVAVEDIVPMDKGGTGATTAAQARTNLGLAATNFTSVTPSKNIGAIAAYNMADAVGGNITWNAALTHFPTVGCAAGSATLSDYAANGFGGSWLNFLSVRHRGGYDDGTQYGFVLFDAGMSAGLIPDLRVVRQASGNWGGTYKLRTEANTTVDANGFIKNASPIIELYADKIKLNDEAQLQTIIFEKRGIGDYLIQGSSGFAQEGWYVEQPKDANGNVYHAVLYEALENGDLSIKTYNKTLDSNGNTVADLNSPVDIKENRFISIRLNELPTDGTAPPNPTIVDNQGNPAPTKYHQLVDGIWVISAEDQELLEIELMAQMPKLTRRQFRLALVTNGYDLAEIEALISSIEDPLQRQIIQIEWQDSTVFERTSNSLNYMATLLKLNRDQINALWQQALLL